MRGKVLNIPKNIYLGMEAPNYVEMYLTLPKQHVSKRAFDILVVGQKWWWEDISYVTPCIILRGVMVGGGGAQRKPRSKSQYSQMVKNRDIGPWLTN